MDPMKLRRAGQLERPWSMKYVELSMRLCLAAHLAHKPRTSQLGIAGNLLKWLIEHIDASAFVLHSFIKQSERIIGIGGQSLVMISDENEQQLDKYNFLLAGLSEERLQSMAQQYQREYDELQQQFGDVVQPTIYHVATLPLRGPAGTLRTLCATQPKLQQTIDIFHPQAAAVIARKPELQATLHTLTQQTRDWVTQNKWLDIIGPHNIVIALHDGQSVIRIVDVEPYVPSYLSRTNPLVGKSYLEVFCDRLAFLESATSQTPTFDVKQMYHGYNSLSS